MGVAVQLLLSLLELLLVERLQSHASFSSPSWSVLYVAGRNDEGNKNWKKSDGPEKN
jgi:hypothetical protein